MDPEIESLRREVKRLGTLVEDTNSQVHKMRRASRWALLFQIVWWLSVIGITGAIYYYYLLPYIQAIMEMYGQLRASGQEAQNFGLQVEEFFRNFRAN